MRLDLCDQFGRGFFGEIYYVVNHLQRRQDSGAVRLFVDRTVGTFEFFDRGIGVEADDEDVAKGPGFGEVMDMPHVDDVEDAIGEDDFFALFAKAVAEGGDVFAGNQF